MARYINESKLIQAIIKERDKIPLTIPCAYYELLDVKPNSDGQSQRAGIRKALRCIAEAPTADVVEVVRCKDCKYWVEEKDFGMFCSHWGSTLAESQADDFCSYGERKIETDNTYFTPEDVVKMSEAEVKENYQTIMKSMDKWGGKDT